MRIVPLQHPPPPIRSDRAREVARWFGLPPHARTPDEPQRRADSLGPAPGQILLILGPSGSGKSTLLRTIRRADAKPERWIDVNALEPANRPLVDCFDDTTVSDTLRRLARVGLCEAHTALRLPGELSEGQRFRLRLALALRRCERIARPILVCDEFATALDRVTAMVVARAVRRCIGGRCAAALATSHDDLIESLRPDRTVRCDFARASVVDAEDSAGERQITSTVRSGSESAAPRTRSPASSASSSRAARSGALRPS